MRQNSVILSEKFSQEDFNANVADLAHIVDTVNSLNQSTQGSSFKVIDHITSSLQKSLRITVTEHWHLLIKIIAYNPQIEFIFSDEFISTALHVSEVFTSMTSEATNSIFFTSFKEKHWKDSANTNSCTSANVVHPTLSSLSFKCHSRQRDLMKLDLVQCGCWKQSGCKLKLIARLRSSEVTLRFKKITDDKQARVSHQCHFEVLRFPAN